MKQRNPQKRNGRASYKWERLDGMFAVKSKVPSR
jgi:hypothetical protein